MRGTVPKRCLFEQKTIQLSALTYESTSSSSKTINDEITYRAAFKHYIRMSYHISPLGNQKKEILKGLKPNKIL